MTNCNIYYPYFCLVLLAELCCAVAGSPVAAQDFLGRYADMPVSKQIQLEQFSELPARVLFTDAHYSKSRIAYQHTDGDFRSYQQPEYAQHISLSSYGLTSYKKIRLEGQIEYRKELEENIGWKLVRDAYHQPHYYGNIRPGDWDNDRYDLQLNGGTSFLDERLLLAVGADYKMERLARYNDPRPIISYYHLFLKAQIGWNFENHWLAVYHGRGNTDEQGQMKNFFEGNNSYGQREYNIITVTGIGSYNLNSYKRYKKPVERKEVGFSYQFKNTSWQFNAEALGGRTQSDFLSRDIVSGDVIFIPITNYFQDYVKSRLFLSMPRQNYTLQVLSNTTWSDGYDDHKRFGGPNYFDGELQQELRFFYYNADETVALQMGIHFNQKSFTDRNASHHYEYQRLAPDLSLQYSTSWGARSVSIIPAISYNMALTDDIRLPTLEEHNLLTNYLVSPDYYLHTSDVLGLKTGLQFMQKFQNLSVAVLLEYHHNRVLKEGTVFGDPAFMPGNHRNYLSLTLQFFH